MLKRVSVIDEIINGPPLKDTGGLYPIIKSSSVSNTLVISILVIFVLELNVFSPLIVCLPVILTVLVNAVVFVAMFEADVEIKAALLLMFVVLVAIFVVLLLMFVVLVAIFVVLLLIFVVFFAIFVVLSLMFVVLVAIFVVLLLMFVVLKAIFEAFEEMFFKLLKIFVVLIKTSASTPLIFVFTFV